MLIAGRSTAKLVRINEGSREVAPIALGGEIRGAGFSPDGQFAVVYGDAARVVVCDISAGLSRFISTDSAISFACFAPKGAWLLTVSESGTAQARRILDGKTIDEKIAGQPPLSLGAYSPAKNKLRCAIAAGPFKSGE